MQISYMKFFDNLVSEEDRMIRATARKFAEREIAPHAHEWEEAEDFLLLALNQAHNTRLNQLGLLT